MYSGHEYNIQHNRLVVTRILNLAVIQINLIGELAAYLVQGRLRPGTKPVQHATIEEGWRGRSTVL